MGKVREYIWDVMEDTFVSPSWGEKKYTQCIASRFEQMQVEVGKFFGG